MPRCDDRFPRLSYADIESSERSLLMTILEELRELSERVDKPLEVTPTPSSSLVDLKDLLSSGVITPEEYIDAARDCFGLPRFQGEARNQAIAGYEECLRMERRNAALAASLGLRS